MSTEAIITYHLNQKILPGLVALGRYSDDACGLTVATPSNKILIYDVRKLENPTDETVRSLNIPKPITGLLAVRFDGDERDALVVSTNSTVYAYDVDRNVDLFNREVVDGANALAIGSDDDVLFVGGNCSVQGYDKIGSDVYWIVTGDNVRSVAVVDVDRDGESELVVGSEDYDIRVFKKDDLLHEITETQIVTHLHCLGSGIFAYALANGTVGVYDRLVRLWRVKSKNRATFLASYDINGDGSEELITGWQGGKVDGRDVRTGEVLFKDNFDQTIAGICVGDCRDDGKNDLIVASISGEIRCYNPKAPRHLPGKARETSYEEETIRELLTRKQALLLELKKYEYNWRLGENRENQDGAIPAKTRLQTSLGISLDEELVQNIKAKANEVCSGLITPERSVPLGEAHCFRERNLPNAPSPANQQVKVMLKGSSTSQVPHVEVNLSTNNETIIRAVTIFAEGIFKDETHVKHPKLNEATGKLTISLYPPRDVPIDIHIKAFIGYRESRQFHVFELTRQLPRFSMYSVLNKPPSNPVSNVVFFVNERIQRIILWVNRNFLLSKPLDSNTYSELSLNFLSLRDGKELSILMDPSGKVTIHTDNIVLAGDLIQSLATYLNVEQLKSIAHFPREEENCSDLLEKLRELEIAKRRLNVDLSNKSSLIRNLIVRGEDARLLNDLKLMKRFYSELNELNKDLRGGYEIRVNNYNDIVATVKELNGIVQKASRLRFGKFKTDPVSLAKSAIASNNSSALIKVIRTGEI